MKAALRVGKWRPLVGVCCLSLATVGLSLRLEGAAPKIAQDGANAPSATAVEATSDTPTSDEALRAKARRIAPGSLPTFKPQIVDWRDDEPTRLRNAGLLDGALPGPTVNRVAGGGCTYDVECEGPDPCKIYRCDIDVSQGGGSGTCVETQVPEGQPGGCDDGLFCNGAEFCNAAGMCEVGPPASCCDDPENLETCTEDLGRCVDHPVTGAETDTPGRRCTEDRQCGSGFCNHCIPACTTDADCDDGFGCNGAEVCNAGVCEAGSPLCGASAFCSERRCKTEGGGNEAPLTACTTDEDCQSGNTCEQDPLCFLGRCCEGDTEPVCGNRKLSQTPPPVPTCVATGGKFYAGDGGSESGLANTCGGANPREPGVPFGCPKYSGGIEQLTAAGVPEYPVEVGPMSSILSTVSIDPPHGPGAPLWRIGDDYSVSNDSPIRLTAIRMVGYMSVPDAIFVEFWDDQGNFIEDFLFRPPTGPGISILILEDPLVIPGSGRISAINKREFGPESKFIWLSTTSATTGTNDTDAIYVNDELAQETPAASNFLSPEPGILAFELLGQKVAPPLGGCCRDDGTCTNELAWICADLGGTFQGEGNFCNICEFGDNAGASCGICDMDSTNSGAACDSSEECDGGQCVADNSVCNAGDSTCSNSPESLCTDANDCDPIPGVCSNTDLNCVLDTDCPGTGTCGGEPTCEPGVCAALDACGTGACCSDTDGSCTLTTASGCTSPDVFRGLGSSCEPNCCVQPAVDTDCSDGICYTGADNCADAFVHVIPELSPNDDAHVVTITGDRTFASATEANPDSCWGVADSVASDQGWWEAFSLTGNCTRIRFDYCCTTPTQFGDWAFVAKDCACNETINNSADPNLDLQFSANRGAPFCDEDNLWTIMGLMPAGTYYIPVNSTLEDDLGQYQLHIVAEACPEVACCLPDGTCQDGLNQFECQDLSGTYLGSPNKFPSTALCAATAPGDPGNPCNTGSCCIGPGLCEDEDSGTAIEQDFCLNTLGGLQYKGGLKCEGGTCALDPAFSCNDAADCSTDVGGPGGACNAGPGGERALAQPNPCPVCEDESLANCQLFDNTPNFDYTISELGIGSGIIGADDFVAVAGGETISKVCVWGIYFITDTEATENDCGESNSGDNFRVRIFGTTPEGLPDNNNLIGVREISGVNTAKAPLTGAGSESLFDPPVKTYAFQLTLDPPITVPAADEVYWLEVANSLDPLDDCMWWWTRLSDQSSQGNGIAAGGSDAGGYLLGAQRDADHAFCLDSGFAPPPEPERPCCTCGGQCLTDTVGNCNDAFAEIDMEAINESGDPLQCEVEFVCPADNTPENDLCENATDIFVGTQPHSILCSTTDGINPIETDFGDDNMNFDIWYNFTAPQDCLMRVDMCNTGDAYDSMVAVYSTGTGSCVCPTDQATSDETFIVASDEGCAAGAAAGGPGFVEVPATEGQCFTIRIGNWAPGNTRGVGLLDVSCGPAFCGNNATEGSNGEECDGLDDEACPGGCNPPGHEFECQCGTATCGNNMTEGSEECDGSDDAACPGLCLGDCTCDSDCGNGVKEGSEECDGPSDTSCGGVAGRCIPVGEPGECTCPPRVCGNDFVDPGEECDGIDDELCPGECRQPGDPAGECLCDCGVAFVAPPEIEPNPDGFDRVRFFTFQVPTNAVAGGTETALRVELTSVASPPGAPSGRQVRYVNSFGGSVICPDAAPTFPDYACAQLGCEPEYRDWMGELGGTILAVTGDAVVPSSTYTVSHIAASCGTVGEGADTCASASAGVAVSTGVFGDIVGPGNGPPDGTANVLDISAAVDKVKGLASAFPEPRVWHKFQIPDPDVAGINVLDISVVIDAVKGLPYPFTIIACP